ncbi:hypothetical protein ACHAPI_011076 [Fusarium lateritium]
MSSGYESEGTVDDWDSLEKLEDILADFCQPPFDKSKPNLRFGHLVIPVYLQTSYSMVEMITQAVREASDVSAVIFVMPRIIHRLVRTITVEGLDFLPDFNDQTLEYEWLLSVLRGNRVARGPGPNAWKQAESPMMWQEALVLPDEAFVVFHMDPNLSADCCLALIGIVQWASDVSQRTGSNIRILTTGSYFGNSFLSELAGIHSEYPVAHYELPIPTHVDLIPEQCVDNADGDSILTRIGAHVIAGADDDRHTVLSVPPFKPEKLSLFLGLGVELGENQLLNRYVMDNGSAMVNRVTYQYDQSGFGPKAVIIGVDSGHPIPEYLNEYTHAHIVLAKRCTRSVLDEDSCQIVTADIALTQAELGENQWWCHQVLIDVGESSYLPGG